MPSVDRGAMEASVSVGWGRALMPPLAPPTPPLTDGVVALRGWGDSDAGAIATMLDDREVARWTRVPSPYRERDAIEWLATHPALLRRRTDLPLAIVAAGDGELLGSMALRLLEDRVGEFGYIVGRGARGQGVATRALRLYSRWAFDKLAVERLEGRVQPENAASLAVAERV